MIVYKNYLQKNEIISHDETVTGSNYHEPCLTYLIYVILNYLSFNIAEAHLNLCRSACLSIAASMLHVTLVRKEENLENEYDFKQKRQMDHFELRVVLSPDIAHPAIEIQHNLCEYFSMDSLLKSFAYVKI